MIGIGSSKRILSLLALVVLGALLYKYRVNMLVRIGEFLVVRDKIEAADFILLLNGGPAVRPDHAVHLFHQGMAPKVMIARAEDSPAGKRGVSPNNPQSSVTMLETLGVPEANIIELRPTGGVKHTVDEAKALLDYCREHPLHRVIIVTTDLHSRRARFIFNKLLAGVAVKIMLAPVSDQKYGANTWWTTEDGMKSCWTEYMKLLYYHLRY